MGTVLLNKRDKTCLNYYLECQKNGLRIDKGEIKHPNAYMYGVSLYESENQEDLAQNLDSEMEKSDGFGGLINLIKKEVEKKGRATIEIKSSIRDQRSGIDIFRNYVFSGKTFREPCHYDTRQEFENEELQMAIDNLKVAVSQYSVETQGNVAVVRKAS